MTEVLDSSNELVRNQQQVVHIILKETNPSLQSTAKIVEIIFLATTIIGLINPEGSNTWGSSDSVRRYFEVQGKKKHEVLNNSDIKKV